MHAIFPLLKESDFPVITRNRLEILQVNLGYQCNQQCVHCHVNAGPNRKEMMSRDTVDEIIDFVRKYKISIIDLTGGAPELNQHFRYLVESMRALSVKVIDRCNLTILSEPGQEGLAEFLAENKVEISASLPCYSDENVDAQRGKGVFKRSIDGLRKLNLLGYGQEGSGLILNLVYNPTGPFLPPPQSSLDADYKKELVENYGVAFNQLITITNVPVQRFGSMLVSKGQFNGYMDLLRENYREENLGSVMCRSLLSIDWQGYFYDCDFNQMLNLPAGLSAVGRNHISELSVKDIEGSPIAVMDHCYACTAGNGSSCSGALT
jgi:radical SAM/Cys-rich protein